MNRKLYEDIYAFAEDSEIDYNGLMEVARRWGKHFTTESTLQQFKLSVDKFLVSKAPMDLKLVEQMLSEGSWDSAVKGAGDQDHAPEHDLNRDFDAMYDKYMKGKPKSAGGPDDRSGRRAGSGKWERDPDKDSNDANRMPKGMLKNPRAN